MNKVKGGTPIHGIHLCQSCQNGSFIKGHAESQVQWRCGYFDQWIRYPIAECSAYANSVLTKSNLFYKTAWILVPDKKGRLEAISPVEFKKRDRYGKM